MSTRRSLPMPVPNEWPRVGKIRLGEKVAATNKAGQAITRPSKIDYFRVDGEDGVTSPEAAESFHRVFGDRPTVLRCQLPGRSAGDVFEGAYKLYGAAKLKIRCDGATCDERTPTGGWVEKPCVCKARGIFDTPQGKNPHKDRCKLAWTLNILLPEVEGIGVWQINTGSEISVMNIARWLQMMERVAGDLMLLEFNLHLVGQQVNPPGAPASTVYVLEPRAVSATPAALMAGEGRAAAAIPAQTGGPAMPDDDDALEPDEIEEPDESQGPPEAGSPLDLAAREMMDSLRSFQLFETDAEIGAAAAAALNRSEIRWWELGYPEVGKAVTRAFIEEAERRRKAEQPPGAPGPGSGQREPDDPVEKTPDPTTPPEGQEAMSL